MKKLKKVRERKYLRKRGEEKCHERERVRERKKRRQNLEQQFS